MPIADWIIPCNARDAILWTRNGATSCRILALLLASAQTYRLGPDRLQVNASTTPLTQSSSSRAPIRCIHL
jgi:hypothetical protein